ncbi:MAG: GumC family protein [Thermosynechococcaceae cyanobacterium]
MEISSHNIVLKPSARRSHRLWRFGRYLIVGSLSNALLWGGTIHFLKTTPPTYRSSVVLNIVGGGPGVNLNLPDIGQAVTSSQSSFNSAHSDPRDNYKEIAMSGSVLDAAAAISKVSPEVLGEPAISLVANTTLMSIELEALSPEMAQTKAKAMHEALAVRLEVLREGEQDERNKATNKALVAAQKKLTEAQSQVSDYKANSGLHSSEQVKTLISNIEQLRQKRAEAISTRQQSQEGMEQLAQTLKVAPQQAAEALSLQADQEFQKSLEDYTTSTTTLLELQPLRGPNYPDVVEARNQQTTAQANLLSRSQVLLGRPIEKSMLERLILSGTNSSSDGSGGNRSALYKSLVEEQMRYQGLSGEVTAMTQEVASLENLLRSRTRKESELDSRIRDLQIAEAIFAATLAKLDLSKGDPFASYPIMQVVEEPSQPKKPNAPKKSLVLVGSAMGSLLMTIGLTLIWYRQPLVLMSRKVVQGIID